MSTGIGLLMVLCASSPAMGQTINTPKRQSDRWSLHAQITTVVQGHGRFSALYSGQNSLSPDAEIKTSLTATLFTGVRLWDGAELFCNPELVGGEGVSSTLGIAAFPNGEIFRVGDPGAKLSISRLFFRYTIRNGGGRKESASDANEIGGIYDMRRLRITLGKFSVVDYVDDNKYSHDARTQFLNWGLMDNGAWDYPADTCGYTWGAVFEYIEPQWALRSYVVMVPSEANGMRMDPMVSRANAEALELEYQTAFCERPGSIRIAAYLNYANIGDGHLSYAPESATEVFYQFPLFSPIVATVNYQLIIHPAYNSDRGPVSLGALRIHWEI